MKKISRETAHIKTSVVVTGQLPNKPKIVSEVYLIKRYPVITGQLLNKTKLHSVK